METVCLTEGPPNDVEVSDLRIEDTTQPDTSGMRAIVPNLLVEGDGQGVGISGDDSKRRVVILRRLLPRGTLRLTSYASSGFLGHLELW